MDLYQIVRGLGVAGPSQVLRTYAYNDKYASVADSGFKIRNSSVWDALPHYHFVQSDGFFYISAMEYIDLISCTIPDLCKPVGYGCVKNNGVGCDPGDVYPYKCGWYDYDPQPYGHCKWFSHHLSKTWPKALYTTVSPHPFHRMFGDTEDVFSFPAATGTGNIVNVSIRAFAQGKCKTSIKVGSGTKTYSATTSEKFVFSWAKADYPLRPDGAAWDWADLAAGNVQAGIYLYCNSGSNSGICRHFCIVITSDDGTETTIWPSGDVSATSRLIVGNPLVNSSWAATWAATGSLTYPCLEATTPAAGTVVDRYIASDLSEVPPRFSVIGGITVASKYRASSAYAGSYARAFLEIGGTKYYGTSHAINITTATLHNYTDTWLTNPATPGLPWVYDDFVGIKFGLRYHAGGTATATALYLFDLYQDTTYQERAEIASLHSISGCTFDSHAQYDQNPIQPDDLIFYAPFPLPERLEISFYQKGVPRFQGFVWSNQEMADGTYLIKAKAQQVGLQYRVIPTYYHRPRVETFDSAFTINELFSDDVPTYPAFSHVGKRQNYTSSEID